MKNHASTTIASIFITASLFLIVTLGLFGFTNASKKESQQGRADNTNVTALESGGKDYSSRVIHEHNFGVWRYVAYQREEQNGIVEVTISLNDVSKDGLLAYVEANKLLAADLAQGSGRANIKITFRSAVKTDEYLAWVTKNNLEVNWLGAQTQGGIMGVRAQKGGILPRPSTGEVIIGVTGLDGNVDAARLPQIASDPLVFLADVTPAVVQRELTTAGIANAANANISFVGLAPFIQMQKFGLVSLPSPLPSPVETSQPPLPVPTTAPTVSPVPFPTTTLQP